jgi:hypothetical protein
LLFSLLRMFTTSNSKAGVRVRGTLLERLFLAL